MDSLKQLYRDERGAEGLEKLLIIAAIVLPLLGILILFRNEIKEWVVGIWEEATKEAGGTGDDDTPWFGGSLD
jgi:Flp pilus assembly pilin Flp